MSRAPQLVMAAALALPLAVAGCGSGGGSSGGAPTAPSGTVDVFVKDDLPALPPGVNLLAASMTLGRCRFDFGDGGSLSMDLSEAFCPLSKLVGDSQWLAQVKTEKGRQVTSITLTVLGVKATFKSTTGFIERSARGPWDVKIDSLKLTVADATACTLDVSLKSLAVTLDPAGLPKLDFNPQAILTAAQNAVTPIRDLIGKVVASDPVAGTIVVEAQNFIARAGAALENVRIPVDLAGCEITRGLVNLDPSRLAIGDRVRIDGALERLAGGLPAIHAQAVEVLERLGASDPTGLTILIIDALENGDLLALVTGGPPDLYGMIAVIQPSIDDAMARIGETYRATSGLTTAELVQSIEDGVPLQLDVLKQATGFAGVISAVADDLHFTVEAADTGIPGVPGGLIDVDATGALPRNLVGWPLAVGRQVAVLGSQPPDGGPVQAARVIVAPDWTKIGATLPSFGN
jgi:hypothetical protein